MCLCFVHTTSAATFNLNSSPSGRFDPVISNQHFRWCNAGHHAEMAFPSKTNLPCLGFSFMDMQVSESINACGPQIYSHLTFCNAGKHIQHRWAQHTHTHKLIRRHRRPTTNQPTDVRLYAVKLVGNAFKAPSLGEMCSDSRPEAGPKRHYSSISAF